MVQSHKPQSVKFGNVSWTADNVYLGRARALSILLQHERKAKTDGVPVVEGLVRRLSLFLDIINENSRVHQLLEMHCPANASDEANAHSQKYRTASFATSQSIFFPCQQVTINPYSRLTLVSTKFTLVSFDVTTSCKVSDYHNRTFLINTSPTILPSLTFSFLALSRIPVSKSL